MKLGLGTVQFGVDYGVSNPDGRTSADEVVEILSVARRNGIRVLDTAALYGSSEQVLGTAMAGKHQFRLITKTIRFDNGRITPVEAIKLEKAFGGSLEKLRCSSVYGLMIHNADDLLLEGGHLLIEKMSELKQRGVVEKIGVSIYTAEHIDRILEKYSIDIIQVPINVLDQRLLHSGHLARLKEAGVEIHARSIFLQGLLLMEIDALPQYFRGISEHLSRYRAEIEKQGVTPLDAALGFVAGLDEVDFAICGVNNHQQLEEICSGFNPLPREMFTEFALQDESILNPSKWKN